MPRQQQSQLQVRWFHARQSLPQRPSQRQVLLQLVALVAQALLRQRLPPRLQFQRRQFQRRPSRHLASHPEIFAQAFLVQPANHNAGDVLVRQQPRQRNFWIQRAAGKRFFHKHGLV